MVSDIAGMLQKERVRELSRPRAEEVRRMHFGAKRTLQERPACSPGELVSVSALPLPPGKVLRVFLGRLDSLDSA